MFKISLITRTGNSALIPGTRPRPDGRRHFFAHFALSRGSSAIEVMSVVVFILGVLIAFGPYIQRGVAGHGKALGDALGHGRQYDPRNFGTTGEGGGTLNCFFDQPTGQWIDEDCYRRENCDCTLLKFDNTPLPEYQDRCVNCKNGCVDDRCG